MLNLPAIVCAGVLPVQVNGNPDKLDVGALWGTYQAGRIVRAASIHGMARELTIRKPALLIPSPLLQHMHLALHVMRCLVIFAQSAPPANVCLRAEHPPLGCSAQAQRCLLPPVSMQRCCLDPVHMVVHMCAGFAAIMASTYKAYLGEGLGPLEWIKQFQIPHPGRVIGRAVLHLTMPSVLDWVLGGNNSHLARARPSACRVEDRLKVGSEG
jgi:hypothetical protein